MHRKTLKLKKCNFNTFSCEINNIGRDDKKYQKNPPNSCILF